MAARAPRRTFAAPFVAISLAACHGADPTRHEPIHYNPGPPQMDAMVPPPQTDDATLALTPPPPPPDDKPKQVVDDGSRHWTVTRHGATCEAFDDDSCKGAPAGATCNPPSPQTVPCPMQLSVDNASLAVVRYPRQTDCFIQQPPPSCPPNVMCNPGPPTKIPCPH